MTLLRNAIAVYDPARADLATLVCYLDGGTREGDNMLARQDDPVSDRFGSATGRWVVTPARRAQRLLGLLDDEAAALFDPDADLPVVLEFIAARQGDGPGQLSD